jgi:antitoxin (DNA-binding transcriptional repressor) of toxin-antitoxin stability system
MEFITVRDLRIRSAEIWEKLREQGELVLTNNGKPIAILSDVEQDSVEEVLTMLRRARAQVAVSRLRQAAAQTGMDRLTLEDVNAEIAAVRTANAHTQ